MSEAVVLPVPERDLLVVAFLGEEHVLSPAEDLRFGRSADLALDENPFMHRVVGRLVHREGVWWLQNHGTKTRLEVRDVDHLTVLEAAPGQQVPVTGRRMVVRFTAGPTTYELELRRSGPVMDEPAAESALGTATIDFGQVPLSPEQHLLIVALYESSLRCGTIEGSSVIARRLGWTPKKFHRKLDAVCDKLSRAGVPGLKGHAGDQADTRREALVAHALRVGLVGPADLGLIG